ncbi:aldehyde-activating protein [Brucella endophytica]|uniref:Aldehyde-activating protein n=1 Tax=Brucella endophytica TaxID=1963359 RepID=A0A916WEM0_9HYPH|nr:GFA family protein [Brucella endophytica]GGA90783.1 aldehyde-activating protein [Brucella endophytica]
MQYHGSCHCGEVRYKVDIDLSQPIVCNCSYCSRRGSILAFTPAENFEMEKGEKKLTEYRFNTKKIEHLFCEDCGVESFSRGTMPDGTKMVAINLRCLEGVDVADLKPTPFNGRSH